MPRPSLTTLYREKIDATMTIIMTYKSVTLTTEYRSPEPNLKVFANRVLRNIFEPNTDAVTGGWIKVCDEKLHNSCSSPVITFFLSCGTKASSGPRPPRQVARRRAIFGRAPVDE
jgi:hypothetical protein